MGYIYKVTNKVNGKMYIGQTRRTIDARWKQHVYSSFKDRTFDKGPFHLAIKKYGPEAFVVEQLEECDNDYLNDRETYWIKQLGTFGNGYNITLGGEHHFHFDSDGMLQLWNDGFSVKEIAQELGVSRRAVSDRLKGLGIDKSKTTARGMKLSGETKRLPVYMYDREGNYIDEFNSRQEAAKAIGVKSIGSACFNDCTVGGYQFRRYRVDKLDTVIQFHEHEVHQYTMEGDYIATYPSLREAAKGIGQNHNGGRSIGAVCRDSKRTQAYGYRWSFDKVDKLPPLQPPKKCRPVVRVSLDGKERTEYCSAAEAGRQHNVSANVIINVCRGKQRTSAGYRWEYAVAS